MNKKAAVLLACLLQFAAPVFAGSDLRFSLHKLESGRAGPTVLVVGGIQGDEPGGFNAASLLATRYRITGGCVWVVPNLNFISIIKRTRGVYGDLNRKFAALRHTDPEFKTIQKIKEIILDDRVDLVVNLHDGSGFYRTSYVDRMHNPLRWGQCVIIDQERTADERFGALGSIARRLVADVNGHLLRDEHRFHVKNTKTHLGNREMEKTLTYFAIRNAKPAIGLEVSKSFPTHRRAYYHLRMLESCMDVAGIEYERSFELTDLAVKTAINSNVELALYDNKIFLDVANARNRLGYMPLKKNAAIEFTPSNPLLTIVSYGSGYRVHHGNRRLTRIYPQYFEYDSSIDAVTIAVDGDAREVAFGQMIPVGNSFLVQPQDGYRVNVIGFHKPGLQDESGVPISRDEIRKRFSIDRQGTIYRIEVYRGDKFSGMILVRFSVGEPPRRVNASGPQKVSLAGYRPGTEAPGSPTQEAGPPWQGR